MGYLFYEEVGFALVLGSVFARDNNFDVLRWVMLPRKYIRLYSIIYLA